jgi:hypothetical protein
MGMRGILDALKDATRVSRKLLGEPRARLRCKGSFDCDLLSRFAEGKSSLRMTSA